MEKSQTSTKEFYRNHSKELRVSARNLRILAEVPRWIHGKTVLDVGCGNGFITTCMSVYATVKGIDIDDDIQTYNEAAEYDVVTCFDVLEHIPNLEAALTNIVGLVKFCGLIIINQPEQTDASQPIDNLVPVDRLLSLGKLLYFENYKVGKNESYNFVVIQV